MQWRAKSEPHWNHTKPSLDRRANSFLQQLNVEWQKEKKRCTSQPLPLFQLKKTTTNKTKKDVDICTLIYGLLSKKIITFQWSVFFNRDMGNRLSGPKRVLWWGRVKNQPPLKLKRDRKKAPKWALPGHFFRTCQNCFSFWWVSGTATICRARWTMFRRHADFGFELKIGSFTRQLIERVLTFQSWHCPVAKDYWSDHKTWSEAFTIQLDLAHPLNRLRLLHRIKSGRF